MGSSPISRFMAATFGRGVRSGPDRNDRPISRALSVPRSSPQRTQLRWVLLGPLGAPAFATWSVSITAHEGCYNRFHGFKVKLFSNLKIFGILFSKP